MKAVCASINYIWELLNKKISGEEREAVDIVKLRREEANRVRNEMLNSKLADLEEG